jgi:hypothetical protein
MSIKKLKNTGTDAFANLFEIVVPPVPGIDGFDGLVFRIKTLEIPERSAPGTYEVHYKTAKQMKLNSKFENENELVIPIRMDRNWLANRFFLAWMRLGINQATGLIDEALIPKVPISVYSIDSEDNATGGYWVFNDFYPYKMGSHTFDHEAGDPIEKEITGIYTFMDDSLS